ncbi:hypothetical protein [Pseudomonas guariconensis]|uniref:hypothetical protein n=1 Tax=Pseudomonas guariconensis TaxID=1288410 RepID=UPI002D1E5CD6|nr:hypothetical protein [Pseudomonas guariconensis]MEB3840523.1 hypothetical protein [Pseudomonas guariconensis]MEB3873391.1 hypothetical protein [Pseudomonas guariconensis]MEB3879758.1 hypothetical protein [Pseudomonas guariconensis]MEB3895786.1 hypothetical protein [Pseudomonas guariconensis]
MSQAKERPILFSGPMVRAILDGRKTVTRRALKVQPRTKGDIGSYGLGQPFIRHPDPTKRNPECPYGRPGDRLWVREAWAQINVAQAPGESWVVYRECDNRTDYGGPWKPSIHMRRRDSRILLEITSVHVERLQEITPNQCIAEGAWRAEDKELGRGHEAISAFADLWRSTGGDWDANPWVWVVEFKRIEP